MAVDPRRVLLLAVPDRPGDILHRREDRVVGGADPLPLVRRIRRIHEVQRTRRGLAQIRTQTIQNCKYTCLYYPFYIGCGKCTMQETKYIK